MSEIGHRIKILRTERNLKQCELADLIRANGQKISNSMICHIENGNKGLSIRVATAIAHALGVTLDDIVSVN